MKKSELRLFSMSAANILQFTYGYYDANIAHMIIDAMGKSVALGVPGVTPVDLFPFSECTIIAALRSSSDRERVVQYLPLWLPGTASIKLALDTKEVFMRAMNEPFDEVKKQRVSTTIERIYASFSSDSLGIGRRSSLDGQRHAGRSGQKRDL